MDEQSQQQGDQQPGPDADEAGTEVDQDAGPASQPTGAAAHDPTDDDEQADQDAGPASQP